MERVIAAWEALRRDEETLATAEAEAGVREAASDGREGAVIDGMRRIQERRAALEARLSTLRAAGSEAAAAALAGLPPLAPPPGTGERRTSIEARRSALAAREAALQAREAVLTRVSGALTEAEARLAGLEQEAERLEQEARARAEAQARAVARVRSEAAAEARGGARRAAGGLASEGLFEDAPGAGLADAIEEALAAAEPARRSHLEVVPDRSGPPRGSPRRRLDCAVDLQGQNNFFTGFARNLSAGGLFVATFDLLPVGSEVELAFELPDGGRVETRAEVRWVRDLQASGADLWPGLGLRFLELPAAAEAAIERFMERREPLFFPDA